MPYFVVQSETTVRAVADAVLKERTRKADREAAIEAIRRANPGLDLEQLRPGQVLVIPELTGTRMAGRDPLGTEIDHLAALVSKGLGGLATDADRAVEQSLNEIKETTTRLDSAAVRRLSERIPEFKETVAELRTNLKTGAEEARRQADDLHAAIDTWAADLETLRRLIMNDG
jgi:ribosome-associated translation inhibitor RaiA